MKTEDIIFIIFILFVLVGAILLFNNTFKVLGEEENACKEIGYKEVGHRVGGVRTCQDYNRDLIFVEFECKGFLDPKCEVYEINVGDVNIAKEEISK